MFSQRSNRLTGPGTAAILSRISNKLTKLDLSSNSIGVEGCRAVAESISTCHQLVDINLERNSLCNDSGIILARALVGSNSIVTCRLGFNNLGDFAATAIGEALQVRIFSIVYIKKFDINILFTISLSFTPFCVFSVINTFLI